MNVLFVTASFPGRVKEYLILPSLEMCIQSAILKSNGNTVRMYDMKIDQISAEQNYSYMSELNFSPDIIYIDDSPETHFTSKVVIRDARRIYGDSVLIGIRGEIESFEPLMIMERNPDLDFIIRYDDDYCIERICEALEEGVSFCDIPNLVYRNGDEIKLNTVKERDYDLNALPYPDRKLYDISKYLQRDSETIVRSSRGCPGRCLFCIKTRYEKFGLFSIERFVDEIEEMQQYGFESFFFSDDTFAFSDQRVKEFAEEIEKRGLHIRFTSNIRIKDINDYKIATLKKAGAYRVFVGIETINSKSSSTINKNLMKDEILEKISILKKYGMEFHASFIIGAPDDTDESLGETIDFIKIINPTVVTFNTIKCYPGLPLYDNPQKYGIIMEDKYWFESDEWTKRCVMGTNNIPPEKVEKWARRMLYEFIAG